MTNLPLFGVVVVLTLGASRAVAQAPRASPPPPPPQTAAPAPVLRPPSVLPPPPARAPSATPAAAATRAPIAAPVQPLAPASALPPDSVRPAAAAARAEPPANAVAQCKDGTFVVPPNDASACASHRGLLVLMPQRAAPPARAVAARMPVSAPAAARAAAPSDAPAPDGATMRCKDGTYLTGAPSEGRCDAYGGVAAVLPAPRTAPPPPLPRRP